MSTKEFLAKAAHYQRAWRTGMTVAELDEFLDSHGHKCDICDRPANEGTPAGGLVIDHDHMCCGSQAPRVAVGDRPKRLCGKCIRGLLCHACNNALGMFKDRPELMDKAKSYLAGDSCTVT